MTNDTLFGLAALLWLMTDVYTGIAALYTIWHESTLAAFSAQ
jgi:hypothetical protein